MGHDDRHNDNDGGAPQDPSDSDVYPCNDAGVYHAFCASDNDAHHDDDASDYGVHATFCNAGKYVLAVYIAYCANRDDHHIPFGNDRGPRHGVYDASDPRREQKIHQHLPITLQLLL